MREIYTVTVQTADGKLLIQEKTTSDFSYLCYILAPLFNLSISQLKDSQKSETGLGSGIQSCALGS